MKNVENMKVLYIIVNAGFADEIVDYAREAGAVGATIINARGTGHTHKAILGITIDTEKDIILIITEEKTADQIVTKIKEKIGIKSPSNCICFTMPVEKTTGIASYEAQVEEK